jgi:DNA-binding response OmpR family regulator
MKIINRTLYFCLPIVMMPCINGFELVDRVLHTDSQIPVLFMSGEALGAYRGFKCVRKPILPAELVKLVDQALTVYAPSERAPDFTAGRKRSVSSNGRNQPPSVLSGRSS